MTDGKSAVWGSLSTTVSHMQLQLTCKEHLVCHSWAHDLTEDLSGVPSFLPQWFTWHVRDPLSTTVGQMTGQMTCQGLLVCHSGWDHLKVGCQPGLARGGFKTAKTGKHTDFPMSWGKGAKNTAMAYLSIGVKWYVFTLILLLSKGWN